MHAFLLSLLGIFVALYASGTIVSVLNGIMSYYKVPDGVKGQILKAIDLLAVLARKESPQTFKAPFTRSLPPIADTVVSGSIEGAVGPQG